MKQLNEIGLAEDFTAEVTFNIGASLHQDCCGGESFVHEILGKISVRNVDDETEEPAGEVRAWLVQFREAQLHGIGSRVLGDGFSQEISNYWQELFDQDEREFKAEIQRGWNTAGADLLIIGSFQISPKFEASGIGLAALGRTVALFSRSCDLVACCPEEINDSLLPETDPSRLMAAQTAGELTTTIAKLRGDCVKAGFREWGETGIYLLNPTQKRPDVLLR